MPVTLDQLASAVQGFLLSKLPGAGGDAPGSVTLVFDGFGAPLTPSEFGAGSTPAQEQLLSHQRAAQLADRIPSAAGLLSGWFLARTGSRLSRWYRLTVAQSVPVSTAAAAPFEQRKSAALRELDDNELIEIGGVTPAGGTVHPTGVHDTYYATGMSPTNWYAPDADCWETHHITDTGPTPAGPPEDVPVPVFDLHLAPTEPVEPTEAGHPFEPVEPEGLLAMTTLLANAEQDDPGGTVVVMPRLSESAESCEVLRWDVGIGDPVTAGDTILEAGTDKVEADVSAPASGALLTILVPAGVQAPVGAALGVIGPPVPPAPVKPPDGFSVTFDYCIVSFDRPWWDEVFLAASDWTVPGFSHSQIASGSTANPSSSAITMITIGMVVMRNLKITADWSEADAEALTTNDASLGPFSLSGAVFDNQTLSRPGMQATAWICQTPPVLPPA